jgi:AcrR family transcriptional regulator
MTMIPVVTRWEPNARGRLEQAALELFAEQGFEGTTVEDIATRAGLTKRTFFRYFGDKREVLFAGGGEFQGLFVNALASAPASATPMEAIAVTLEAVSGWFRDRHERARQRQRIIVANAELQERELVKLASVAAVLASALRERGVEEPAASVTAETAIAVFRTSFERWVAEDAKRELADVVRESLDTLRAVTAAG